MTIKHKIDENEYYYVCDQCGDVTEDIPHHNEPTELMRTWKVPGYENYHICPSCSQLMLQDEYDERNT